MPATAERPRSAAEWEAGPLGGLLIKDLADWENQP
jgi:hypothetical protein